jgi:signal transduction histidine kinase
MYTFVYKPIKLLLVLPLLLLSGRAIVAQSTAPEASPTLAETDLSAVDNDEHLLVRLSEQQAKGDIEGILSSYNNLAYFYLNHNKGEESIAYLRKAADLHREQANPLGEAHALNSIGVVQLELSHFAEAADHFRKSLELRKQYHDLPGISHSLLNLGVALYDQGKHMQALSYLEQAMHEASVLNLVPVITDSHHYLALVFQELNNIQMAEFHQKAYVEGLHNSTGNYIMQLSTIFEREQNRLQIARGTPSHELWKREKELEILKLRERELAAIAKARKSRIELLEQKHELQEVAIVAHNAKHKHNKLLIIGSISFIALLLVLAALLSRANERKKLALFIVQKKQRLHERQLRRLQLEHNELLESNTAIRYHDQERQLREQQIADLQHEREQLLRVVSHDLRQPLEHLAYLQRLLAESNFKPSKAQQEKINAILLDKQKAVASSKRVIEQIKRAIETPELHPSTCDLNLLAKQLVEAMQAAANAKGIQIISSVSPKNLQLHTDAVLLRKILESLLHNAIRYSPKEGVVQLNIAKEQAHITIEVADEGPGFTNADQQRLWEKYSQYTSSGKAAAKGGLFIVKHYTELLGADMNCNSFQGEGTAFVIRFPIEETTDTTTKTIPVVNTVQA